MGKIAALAAFLAGASVAIASPQASLNSLVPLPARVEAGNGEFVLNSNTRFVASGPAAPVAETLSDMLQQSTGYALPVHSVIGGESVITFEIDPTLAALGAEGYRLEVTPKGIWARSARATGLFYAGQTLRQLLPAEIYSGKKEDVRWAIPAVVIEDKPRFGWRGLMLDCVRHFMPKEFILKFIDTMAMHKMNRFHWHLTDDQGWRIEIKKYPKLTEVGAWRDQTIIGHAGRPRSEWKFDGQRHGGYYTQDDIREIVAYAKQRFVTVVPEIEMPGHAQAAIAAYPELGNVAQQLKVLDYWGVNPNIFNVNSKTISFLQDVLMEVMDLFPSEYIHIGGDEAPKEQWEKSAEAQARIKEQGLHDEHELQSWFIRQMDTFLEAHGRHLIGWDEILEGGLAPGATVMSWRGTAGGIKAAQAGHPVVMAANSHLYLDYYQSRSASQEPPGIGGFVPLDKVYAFDPAIPELTAEQAKLVLGAQGQLWTEYMKTPDHVEYMAFPRACALSEVVWSPQASRSFDQFMTRLPRHLERLKQRGVNFRPLDAAPKESTIAAWKSGEMSEVYGAKQWDISGQMKEAGRYRVMFSFSGGAHRLEIEWVEIWQGDQLLARTAHHGITGAFNQDNAYDLEIKKLGTGKLTLRASIRADGGTDSNGSILLSRLGG